MADARQKNFSGCLVDRLGGHSCLIDAASGLTIDATDVPRLIAGHGAVFLAAGLQAGERVLVASSLSPLSCLAYLGAMYAGLVVVPTDERSLATSGANLVAATGAKAVWTEQAPSLDWLRRAPLLCFHGELTGGKPQPMAPVARTDADEAALMATSGSTGLPRFIVVTHGNLRANTEAIIRSQGLQEGERAMLVLPFSYCFGASVLHTHLYQGGGVVFDRRFMFPDKVLRAIAQYRCTTFAGVPTAYNVLLQRSKIREMALPSLRRLLQAGGHLAKPVIDEVRRIISQAQFYVMYGQTEATARISCLEPSRLDEKAGSVGRPLDNLAVRIVGERGEDVPPGREGEIWVKGPSVCPGYLNDRAESERVFKDGWLRTRDLGHSDAEGFLWVHGRLGGFLKMRGVRISFTEVEAKVAALPGVLECAAQAVTHPESGEALALLVVPKAGAHLEWDQMRRRLPAHWTFDSIRFVAELPKTANGKLSRSLLARQLNSTYGTS
jgi:acyl-CoA synthetase (AMP-forming)/AMP-acid ligase II